MEDLENVASHFGFVPSDFVDDVINMVNSLMYKVLSDLLTHIPDESAQAAIETLFEHSIDKHFDKFELYCLKNVFYIPKQLQLRSPPTLSFSEESFELDQIRQQIIAEKYYGYRLKSQIAKAEHKLNQTALIISHLPGDPLTETCKNLSEMVTKLRVLMRKTQSRTTDGKFVQIMTATDERKVIDAQKYIETRDFNVFAVEFANAVKIGKPEDAKSFSRALSESKNMPQ